MLIDALPPSLCDSANGVQVRPQGQVDIGAGFQTAELAWIAGIAAMAGAGTRIIIADVFLSAAASQQRMRRLLDGLAVLWGRCPLRSRRRRRARARPR
jgi:chloramphenicol 3-O phosphotransferase